MSNSINTGGVTPQPGDPLAPLSGVSETGAPLTVSTTNLNMDEMVISEMSSGALAVLVSPPFDSPKIDNPNATFLTQKALGILIKKRNAQIEMNKGSPQVQGQKGATLSAIQGNPWMQNPSQVGALAVAMVDFLTVLSKSRFNESKMKQTLDQAIYQLGKENADLAKALKMKEADKQFTEAWGEIGKGIIGITEIYVMSAQRQSLKDKNEAESKEELDAEKKELTRLENQAKTNTPTAATDKNGSLDVNDLQTKGPKAEADAEAINKQKAKIKQVEQRSYDRFNEESRYQTTITETQFRVATNFLSGAIMMQSATITQQLGGMEKAKAMNDAVMQMWNKILETVNKDREDSANQFDKTLQLMTQIFEAWRAHPSRG